MRKGIINVMFANLISLLIGLITNFVLPKFLSVDAYSLVKTYALYITYAGFFSLGYNDGMYLKYGGKDINEINKIDLANNYINYILLILIMLFVVLVVGIFISDMVAIAFAFGMLSYNILGYLKSLYQATGEFKAYSRALNLEKVAIFLITMILIFVFHKENAGYYIWTQVIIGILISILLTIKLDYKLHFFKKGKIALREFKENISSGFILMLGNFSSGIFTGLDRWFVKFLLTSTHFALYSFAVSMENIINVFITPITVSLYNYFCKKPSFEEIKKIKNYVLIWGFIVIAAAFPAKFILETYLPKYIQANSVIFLLFAAQLAYVVIKGIYVNIYKSEKKQNKYLIQMILMILLGALLNALFYCIFNDMISIAAATLVTSLIWLLICEFEKGNKLKYTLNELVAIGLILFVYLLTGYKCNAILGLFVYLVSTILVVGIFMNKTMIDLLITLKGMLRKYAYKKKR